MVDNNENSASSPFSPGTVDAHANQKQQQIQASAYPVCTLGVS